MAIRSRLFRLYTAPKGRLGNAVQGAALAFIERRRVRERLEGADRVVLVHTMGKVGSMAVAASLDAAGHTVFHTHRLSPVGPHERVGLAPRKTWTTSKVLAETLLDDPNGPGPEVAIVSIVRDLMDRNVSAFFQTVERYVPLSAADHTRGVLPPVAELCEAFVDRFDHQAPLGWFDREIRQQCGIDVDTDAYEELPHEARRYRRGRFQLVVLRFDHLDLAAESLAPVLGELPPVGRSNDSSSKRYGPAMREMRERLVVDPALLSALYDSPVATTFFSEAERSVARDRWKAPVTS